MSFPDETEIVIEVPRFGFVKRDAGGRIDFISPLPTPFNYGHVPGTCSGDGEPVDAVVIGPRLPRGTRVKRRPVAVVHFTDLGKDDPKWICSDRPLTATQRAVVIAFFVIYARLKRLLNLAGRDPGPTCYRGIQEIQG
jgi:inorganic pyrophosphatase